MAVMLDGSRSSCSHAIKVLKMNAALSYLRELGPSPEKRDYRNVGIWPFRLAAHRTAFSPLDASNGPLAHEPMGCATSLTTSRQQ
jgi:hypothetical protein